jgi:hypothetical protein
MIIAKLQYNITILLLFVYAKRKLRVQMDSINNSTYSSNNLYNNPYGNVTESPDESTGKTLKKDTGQSQARNDKVTLSNEVSKAKTRELIGLNPVGRLKLEDFESAAGNQKEIVKSKLEDYMAAMGIDKSQNISLMQDEKSNIIIDEKFAGKNELEQALNDDTAFSLAFRRMSANDDILNYVDNLKTGSQVSLANFMSSDSNWDDIISSASRNLNINRNNPLESLLSLSKRTPNYSFSFEVDDKK